MPKLLAGLRPYLGFAALFSLALNLLLLAPSLYMLQVFDRVLTSRSGETLAVLSLAVLIALLTMAALDVTRAYVLAAVGAALDRTLGPRVLGGLPGEAAGRGTRAAVARGWSEVNERALVEQAGATRAGAALSGMTKFTRQGIQSAMLALGAYIVLDQQVTAGVMIAATVLLGRALAPVEQLVAGWRALVEARAAWRRLDVLFSAPTAEVRTALPVPEGKLAAEAVVFGVRRATKPIIRGASFSLDAGEALRIVGPRASGKAALARLLVGIHRASAGTVRLDGADVSAWPRESLGRHIGYMPQDVELFA